MLKCPAVPCLDLLLQMGHEIELLRIAPVDGVGIGVRHRVIATEQVAQFSQAARNVVIHGLIAEFGKILIEIRNAYLASTPQLSAVGQGLTAQQFHERGLARTVLAEYADTLALVNGEVHLVEQGAVAISE